MRKKWTASDAISLAYQAGTMSGDYDHAPPDIRRLMRDAAGDLRFGFCFMFMKCCGPESKKHFERALATMREAASTCHSELETVLCDLYRWEKVLNVEHVGLTAKVVVDEKGSHVHSCFAIAKEEREKASAERVPEPML